MNERVGTCTRCGQRYGNIPPTLEASRVRCTHCGGVVEITPLPDTPAAAGGPGPKAPAAQTKPPAPPSPPQARPIGKPRPRSERPRKARPVDRKAARPVPPRPLRPPAARAPKPETAPSSPPAPSMAEKKARAAEIIARARAQREAGETRPGTQGKEDLAAKKTRAAEILERARKKRQAGESHQHAPASPPRSASPAGRSDSRPKPAPADTRSKPGSRARPGSPARHARGHHHAPPPKKSRAPLWIGLSVLVFVGGGAFWWFSGQGATEQTVPETPVGTPAEAPASQSAPVAESLPVPAESPPAAETPAPQPSVPAAAPKKVSAPKSGSEADSKTIATRGIADFDALDLKAAPPLEKWSGTTDEEWASIQEDVKLFLEDNGVFSTRAGDRLVKIGRGAFPAMVNAMMKLDYKDPEQVRTAGILNTTIGRMSKGKGFNFGWKSVETLEPGSEEYLKLALFDKKIAANWYNSWVTKLADDDAQWANFIGEDTKKKAAETPKAPPAVSGGGDLFDD